MFFRRRKKRGQAIVEMALVFPFFLLIIIGGIIDFGFAFYNFLALQQIANDTAQWAAETNGTSGHTGGAEISSFANSKKPQWWTGNFTVSPPKLSTLGTGGTTLGVGITYESPTYTPFYQTMFQATTGSSHIKLVAYAAYKIPQFVVTR